jgi:hypothetical protein
MPSGEKIKKQKFRQITNLSQKSSNKQTWSLHFPITERFRSAIHLSLTEIDLKKNKIPSKLFFEFEKWKSNV